VRRRWLQATMLDLYAAKQQGFAMPVWDMGVMVSHRPR